jgi:hypothetical protein
MAERQFTGPLAHKEKNIKKLRDAGYDDEAIVDHIIKTKEVRPGKLEKMRETGRTDEEIIHFLLTGRELPQPNIPKSVSRGMAVGGSQILGAPSDIFQFGVNVAKRQADKRRLYAEDRGQEIDVPLGSDFWRGQVNRLAGENYAYGSLEDLPRRDRPFAAAGEVMGGNIALGGPAGIAARSGMLGRTAQQAIRGQRGAQLIAAETGATAGAAQGAFIGEALDPGGYGRIAGELVGGFVNPIGTIYRLGDKLVAGTINSIKSLTPSGRADRASVLIRGALEDAGENPGDIARELRKRGIVVRRDGVTRPLNVTAGQKTGSPTLLRIEQELKKYSQDFGREQSTRMSDALDDIQYMIQALSESGDPELLKAAAKMRAEYINGVVKARLDIIKSKATLARSRFPDSRDMSGSSSEAYKVLDDALEDARKVETEQYWNKVDRTIDVDDSPNIFEAHDDLISGQMKVPADALPALINQQIRRMKLLAGDLSDEIDDIMTKQGIDRPSAVEAARAKRQLELKKGPLTSGELITFRSRMLQESRKARAAKDWVNARIYEQMASGILKDLSAIDAPGYDLARQYSADLNKVFSETFAGDALSVTRQGGERISPELMLIRAFSGGKEKGAVQFAQLENAVRFSNKSMLEQQEDFLRAAATASRKDGVFNPDALQQFLENNDALLSRMPDNIKGDLQDLRRAETVLRQYEKKLPTSYRMRVRAALEQVTDVEDTAAHVGRILNGQTPQRDYLELVKTAKRGGDGAVKGLYTATLDWAYNNALTRSGDLDVTKFKNFLFDPVTNRGPSAVDIMVRNGVMRPRNKVLLKKWIEAIEDAQHSILTGAPLDEIMQSDGLYDLATSVTGARIGAKLGEGGSTLLAASRGSAYARKLFEKLPAQRVRDLIIEASENPKIMAALLERKPSPKRQAETARMVKIWLRSVGLTAAEKMEDSEAPSFSEPSVPTDFSLPVMP